MEDMHIHIRDAINNELEFEKYKEEIIKNGLKRIVLLEHGPRLSPKHNSYISDEENIKKYFETTTRFKKEVNKTEILCGIELDMTNEQDILTQNLDIIKNNYFDWVVGSIHSIKFNKKKDYYDYLIEMINLYSINSIGHMVLDDDFREYEDIIGAICQICNEKKICIEINTSDRSRWNNDQLLFMIKMIKKYKVEHVFGSDAHSSCEIGYLINDVINKIQTLEEKL